MNPLPDFRGEKNVFDAIVFDIDGTLWDSRESVAEAWNRVLSRADPGREPLSIPVLTSLFGNDMDTIAAKILPGFPPERRRSWMELCIAEEHSNLETRPGIPYPGVAETCERLAERFKLLIASNCEAGYPRLAMSACGISRFVADTLCYGETGTPKSETIKTLCRRNGVSSPVYVGDTAMDEAACRAAGVPFIHASYGFGTAEAPFATIREFSDLERLLSPARPDSALFAAL